MKVFSPLVEVQPITPSLDKLWDQHEGAKKDHLRVDKKPSLLFPSSNRRFPLSEEGGGSDHPIFDWKPSSTSKQPDKYELPNKFKPDLGKFTQQRQLLQSRVFTGISRAYPLQFYVPFSRNKKYYFRAV
ncbi:protein NEDD1-like [Camellia sinensis]|uniref:protein NEDD1-like n=1 Tax=Camellia sinensis TaxID=4442 RepID=UPI0010356AB3|nr:protein NEDD1-like [Camellia sinensis]